MKAQSELFGRTIGALRQPAEFARAAARARPASLTADTANAIHVP